MGAATRQIGVGGGTVSPGDGRMPTPVRLAFAALLGVVAADALHEIFGLAGSGYSNWLDSYFYDIAATGAGILMVVHGLRRGTDYGWVFLGLGTFSWVVGDVLSDLKVGMGNGVSVSDAFWLAWYPLAAAGLVMFVHDRFQQFDFTRWIDGIALALVVATPGVALVLQPSIDASHVSPLANVVDVAYPAGDILLVGATVGVIALAGWRPGRSWYLLCVGLSIWVIADSVYSVQRAKGTYVAGVYDYLWPAGLLLIAFAAWQGRDVEPPPALYGWKAVILPVVCQLFALATQVWGLVAVLGESERIMGIAVLTVVVVQLFAGRPRQREVSWIGATPAVGETRVSPAVSGEGPPREEPQAAPNTPAL